MKFFKVLQSCSAEVRIIKKIIQNELNLEGGTAREDDEDIQNKSFGRSTSIRYRMNEFQKHLVASKQT